MPTVVRTAKTSQETRSVADIDHDRARFEDERQKCTADLEDNKAFCDQLEATRRALVERQVIDPDAQLQAQLAANADEIGAAERRGKDVTTRFGIVQRKLGELSAEREHTVHVEAAEALAHKEATCRAHEANIVDVAGRAYAEALAAWKPLLLDRYAARHDLGTVGVGRTPDTIVHDKVLQHVAGLSRHLDRPFIREDR